MSKMVRSLADSQRGEADRVRAGGSPSRTRWLMLSQWDHHTQPSYRSDRGWWLIDEHVDDPDDIMAQQWLTITDEVVYETAVNLDTSLVYRVQATVTLDQTDKIKTYTVPPTARRWRDDTQLPAHAYDAARASAR